MSDLLSLIETLQSNYVREFEAAYYQQLDLNEAVFPEIAVEMSGGTYKKLFVIDLVARNGAKQAAVEILPTTKAYDGGIATNYRSISFVIGQATWDNISITLEPAKNNLVGFEAWFDKWMDLDGKRREEGSPTSNIIHSVSFHEDQMEIDFGTTSTAAFVELVDLFSKNGIEKVRIESTRKRPQ
ncbi:hypothetical protein [Thalassovita mangrovi]|uniref:Uncharacterized protein n=1 Tax=Thalassovita mangrovi TaxID=2692236 RepID=A0A6L8LFC6_9RHOB|nr:hypothetical protein [Thalassovita mangrovi]MYM54777.1 hypothetical protein [Thalassovita mangrovi]